MTPRTLFLIQLIDKLGVPLMNAVQQTNEGKIPAETIAGLLSSSVKLGLSLTDKMGLHEEDGDMDSVRVALSASAAQMIAEYYARHKKIPIDGEHEQISKSVDALISFAENFTASKNHTGRLRNLGDEAPIFDAAQSQIFYLSAMQPVLAAVAGFSFGQSETRLIQEIAEKLQMRAGALREALSGAGADDGEARFTELMILHSLARMYAQIHMYKTAEIEKAGNEEAPAISIETVWSDFDRQVAMLETLLGVALPGGEDTGISTPRSSSSQAEEHSTITPPPPEPEVTAPVPATPPPEQGAPAQEQTQKSTPAGNPGNPMGFFAKKPETAAAPAPQSPPQNLGPNSPSQPDAVKSPEETEKPKPQGNPSNPMSFFKPGAQTDSE